MQAFETSLTRCCEAIHARKTATGSSSHESILVCQPIKPQEFDVLHPVD
jgi:hypothetical protein